MKNLFKLVVMSIAFSGLVACSSAKKDDDSVMADIPAETSVEQADNSTLDSIEDTSSSSDYTSDEVDPSLGTGSSGLGH